MKKTKDDLDVKKWTPEEHLKQMMEVLKATDDYKYKVKGSMYSDWTRRIWV